MLQHLLLVLSSEKGEHVNHVEKLNSDQVTSSENLLTKVVDMTIICSVSDLDTIILSLSFQQLSISILVIKLLSIFHI